MGIEEILAYYFLEIPPKNVDCSRTHYSSACRTDKRHKDLSRVIAEAKDLISFVGDFV
jgi:hypothetical protein